MKFDLKNLNPGTWFTFPDQDEVDEAKKAKISVRIAAVEDVRTIKAKTTSKGVEYKVVRDKRGPGIPKRFEFEARTSAQEQLEQEMLWDLAITDWKNLEDNAGTFIPCTKDNKITLMSGSVPFATFVAECLGKLAELEPTEDEPKN